MCSCLLWLFTLCRCGVVNVIRWPMSGPRGHLGSDRITAAPLLRVPAQRRWWWQIRRIAPCCIRSSAGAGHYLKDLWEISNQESYPDLPHPQALYCQLISILILHPIFLSENSKFPPSDCFSTKLSLLNPSTVSKQQKALVLTVPMEAPGSWLVTPPGWCNL